MTQLRSLPAEILVQQQVLWRGIDPFLTAQHVRDAHQVIIDHIGKVVGRHAIRLEQHLHVDLRPLELDFAAQHVAHLTDALARHPHAHHRRFTGSDPLRHFHGIERQAMPVVTGLLPGSDLLVTQRIEALGGTEAVKRMSAAEQLPGVLTVDLATLTLAIRCMRPAHVRAFIPVQAQPAQRFENRLLGLRCAARAIGILNTQNELPAMLSRKAEIEQRDIGGADMRVTGRRGGNAGAYGHFDNGPDGRRVTSCDGRAVKNGRAV